ncbi:Exonuclease [Corchorus capsularis]|uniref:Exonuclease n=1 Tax=Corchorus capsularis TaxID=210143 RepID=A0A1R3JAT3_COCAP|nr:Exonuclease [Corchorus capsularis]
MLWADKLRNEHEQVLVQIVKLIQKRGLEGTKGEWKDFLKAHDKKFGASKSDPSRRTKDDLVSFLKTFDFKFLDRILQGHLNRNIVEQLSRQSLVNESPEQGWIVTKLSKDSQRMMRSSFMLAVDCEMVLCEDGTEALVKVCVVDRDLQVKINEYVNPYKTVADYRTEITGIDAEKLEGVTRSVADIQKSMKKLLSDGTILVGHSLHNDLQVSFASGYSVKDRPRKSDRHLIYIQSVLGYEVRKPGAAHNCLDDACAAMKLVLAKLERGDIPLVQDVPEAEMEKLLLHKIPNNVPKTEISRIIPGEFAIEIKPSKKAQGRHYAAFAVFNSAEEANRAFENTEGTEEQDISGLRQKLVTFQFGKAATASLYIRKMVRGDLQCQVPSKKREFQSEEKFCESKKHKTDEKPGEETRMGNFNRVDDWLKEIGRLKQEVEQKGSEIVAKDKIIAEREKEIKKLKKKVDKLKKNKK